MVANIRIAEVHLGNLSIILTPTGKDGADSVLAELFSYGTQTRDRIAFQGIRRAWAGNPFGIGI
jgi:hypothetical protein